MADPAIPPIITDTALNNAQSLKAIFSEIGDTLSNKVSGAIDTVMSKFTGMTSAANTSATSTTNAADAMDLLSIGVFGATKAFEAFSDQSKNLNGFTNQLAGISAVSGIVTDNLKKLAIAAGAPAAVINGGAGMLDKFIKNLAASADAALNFQNGTIAMMGASGGLNNVWKQSGSSLEDLNSVMFKQTAMISTVAGATFTSMNAVTGYYKMLGTAIPDSVNKQINAQDRAGKKFDELRATMTLAAGTGRTVEAVIGDMKVAWDQYGLSGDKALDFTAKMSELNNKFGINLEYTEKFMKENASTFHLIAKGGDNASASLNRLFESFRSTGLSAKYSTEIIGGMTGQMAKLTIGQKAFLSAQSGGPGGLKGAMQIENQLAKGDVEGVLKKAEDAVKKKFGGKIYTREDAEQSDFAASQFTKQRAMLNSGAFGNLAKGDDNVAAKILEAFKNGTSGVEALKDPTAGLSDVLTKGELLQETANTELTQANLHLERQTAYAANTALTLAQIHLGSRTMEGRTPEGDERALRLRNAGTDNAGKTSLINLSKGPIDKGAEVKGNALDSLQHLLTLAPEIIKPGIQKLIGSIAKEPGAADKSKSMKELAAIQDKLSEEQKAAAKVASANNKPIQANQDDAKISAIIKQALSYAQASSFEMAGAVTGQAVNDSLASSSGPNPAQQAKNQTGHSPGQHPAQAQKQKMEVTFKAVCFKCNKPQEADSITQHITGGAVKGY